MDDAGFAWARYRRAMSNPEPADRRLLARVKRRGFILTAVAVGSIGVIETIASSSQRPLPLYLAVVTAMTAPIAVLRRFPLAATVVVYLTLLVPTVDGVSSDVMYYAFALIVTAYGLGAHADRTRAWAGFALILTMMIVIVPLDPNDPGYGDAVFLGAIMGTPWVLGRLLRQRQGENAELAGRAELLEREREHLAQLAVAAERARIARELHDVVAHSVSVMAVQTAAVRRRIAADRPADAATLLTVESSARQALAELRRLLGVLRSETDEAALSPQPGLGDLPDLLRQSRLAGLEVDLEIDGSVSALPAGVDLAGYRIVQEALTNTRKHAGAGRARVLVRYRPHEVSVEVTDDGTRQPVPGPGGHGLVGMSERVSLYGGRLEVGPAAGGGFAVRATLLVEP